MITIVVVNSKGGSSKSTTSVQLVGAYFLSKDKKVIVNEFDDENKDMETFTKTKILSKQVEVLDGTNMTDTLRKTILDDEVENKVLDIGGNKSTTYVLDGLENSKMYKAVNLWVVPMSGGHQDLINAKKMFDRIKSINSQAKVLFVLSRVRNIKQVKFQYAKFFKDNVLSKEQYIILTDSNAIDLSRKMEKTVFEIASDRELEKAYEEKIDLAFDNNENDKINSYSLLLEIIAEAQRFSKEILEPAFLEIDKLLEINTKKVK